MPRSRAGTHANVRACTMQMQPAVLIVDPAAQQLAYHASAQLLLASIDSLCDNETALVASLTQRRQDIESALAALHSAGHTKGASSGQSAEHLGQTLQAAVDGLVAVQMESLMQLDLQIATEISDIQRYNLRALASAQRHLESIAVAPVSVSAEGIGRQGHCSGPDGKLRHTALRNVPAFSVAPQPRKGVALPSAAASSAHSGSQASRRPRRRRQHRAPASAPGEQIRSGSGPQHAANAAAQVVRALAALPNTSKTVSNLDQLQEAAHIALESELAFAESGANGTFTLQSPCSLNSQCDTGHSALCARVTVLKPHPNYTLACLRCNTLAHWHTSWCRVQPAAALDERLGKRGL